MARGGKKFNKRKKGAGQQRHSKPKKRKVQNKNVKEEEVIRNRNYKENGDAKPMAKHHAQESSDSSNDEEEFVDAYQQLVSSVITTSAQAFASDDESDDDSSDESGDESDVADDVAEVTNDVERANESGDGTDELSDEENVADHEDTEGTNEEEAELIESEDEREDVKESAHMSDPFLLHFDTDLEDSVGNSLGEAPLWETVELKIPTIGKCLCQRPKSIAAVELDFKAANLKQMHVKQILSTQAALTNTKFSKVKLKETDSLTAFQQKVFTVINSYQDFYYPERTWDNGEELRLAYCLHALNHILKTRSRIIAHSTKLKTKTSDPNKDYRDQGLTRPKVLIVVPFRDSVYRIVNMMISLLMPEEQSYVTYKTRFMKEFGPDEDENPDESNPGPKPDDFKKTFAGNFDDHFRIGISVARKSLKLYSEFYKSDIIISSPLGLRTAIGAEGDKFRDFDFLSSIEVCILDQVDIFHMQNWDHIQHLIEHMHIQPKESHGVDFSRIRMWTLNGWSKFYRQSIILSSMATPAINALFKKHCQNWAGKILVPKAPTGGTIRQIVTQLPQVLHRVDVSTHSEASNARFEFFISNILPKLQDQSMKGVFIFIPSYLDFVRLRNYFKKESINFVHTNEYTTEKGILRSRGLFFHGRVRILMYTERFHFYRRFRVRGIRHIVFYDIPLYAHFYSEICNLLKDPKKSSHDENFTCTVLYTKYDAHRLAAVVGTERAAEMITSEKSVHMLVTGDN